MKARCFLIDREVGAKHNDAMSGSAEAREWQWGSARRTDYQLSP